MRTVDRFNTKQANRVYRNSKVIYQFAKYGSKGFYKINPTLIFIDAAISLGELFISYSQYKKVKEQNIQLEIQIETLKKEFNNLKKRLQIEEDKFKFELKNNSKLIENRLKANEQNKIILKVAYKTAQEYFYLMRVEVEKYKKEYPFSKETQQIERQYYEAVTAYAEISLDYIGG
ncbi:hypothetical protein [Desulfomicrobium baculatum]|uniref:Uncharacterized protein n=1 Tax=Desulfomicrobium baculatum (strain DSM 4028 / VKM B-1378 / X) TaxID=525897 RepID=C7LS09_DESBD|nr:hypothetical protein [Desulfomicrobium baculatum]ACU89392.1 hypothetical protein Dbac_1293 [Desulfomicrobium baculatum DSM 4028]